MTWIFGTVPPIAETHYRTLAELLLDLAQRRTKCLGFVGFHCLLLRFNRVVVAILAGVQLAELFHTRPGAS